MKVIEADDAQQYALLQLRVVVIDKDGKRIMLAVQNFGGLVTPPGVLRVELDAEPVRGT